MAFAYDNVGVSRVDFYVDGVLLGSVSLGEYRVYWDTTLYPDGAHVVKVVAFDYLGNSFVREYTVFVDNTPPVISSVNASYSYGSVLLSANIVENNVAFVRVWYRFEGEAWSVVNASYSGSSWSATVQASSGYVEYYFEAVDLAGNRVVSSLYTVVFLGSGQVSGVGVWGDPLVAGGLVAVVAVALVLMYRKFKS